MVMRALWSLLLGAMLASVVLIPVCLFVPNAASAVEYSGTSPLFAVDTEWSLYVGYFAPGDIIQWYWSSGDSLSFSLLYTVDSTTEQLGGFTDDDSCRVDRAGHYGLWWYNNNLFFSASVDYWVAGFTPFTTITTPVDGAYLNSAAISVQGKTDSYSAAVLVGPDTLHTTEATWSGDDWGVDGYLLTEGQNDILVRTYYWLDSNGYTILSTPDKMIHVTLDTALPDLAITSPSLAGAHLRGTVDVAWQCSDENGIVKREVKVDALGWQDVTADSYTVELADGHHVVSVRVTDLAGNQAYGQVAFICDTVAPQITIAEPVVNSKVSEDHVAVSWAGSDDPSGIDYYEVQIAGGRWTNVGTETSHEFTGLDDGWYSVNVRAVDKSGNSATASVNFGIYTSIWSTNGPYQGIPLFALVAAIIIVAVVATLLLRKKKGGPAVSTVPKR